MPKRVLQGVVVSDKAEKSITVEVRRRVFHKFYKKIITKSNRYNVHDEDNAYSIGDNVKIIECAPISKTKNWLVVKN